MDIVIQTDYIFFFFTGTFVAAFMFLLYLRKKYPGHGSWWAFFALICLYILGIITANWQGKEKDAEIREHLKIQVEAVARTINKDHIKALTFTGSDKSKPEFMQLCDQMKSYKHAVTEVFGTQDITIYSMVRRDNSIIFGPESIKEGDRYASPPGTVYQQPTPELKRLFINGMAFTEGPCTDEYGTFLSAFAPVFDPVTGHVLVVIGMDIGFIEVQTAISHQSMFAYLCIILLVFVLLLAAFLHAMNPKLLKKFRIQAEGINVATFGFVFTIIIAIVLQQNGTKSRNAIFTQVSEPEAKSLCKTFMNLRDYQVSAMVSYFQKPKVIDREAFHSILAPMFRLSGKQTSFGWMIPVAGNQKEKMELKAREDGMKDFTIWQTDLNGKKVAAWGRSTYFPFWYFEPPDGNTQLPGFDPTSNPMVKETIEKAIRTGLPAATNPVFFPNDKGKTEKILVFQPVFTGNAKNRQFQGFIVAVISPQQFIQKAISLDNSEKPQTIVDLYHVSSGIPPRLIACTIGEKHAAHAENQIDFGYSISNDRAVIYPIFVFDKTYIALIFPAPGSFAAIPVDAGPIAAAIGILVTFLLTFLTLLLTRQNETLEHEVEVRTSELRKSEEKYRGFFNSSLVGVAITAPDGKWLFFNDKLCELLGYSREELGNMTWRAITPVGSLEIEQLAYDSVLAGKEPMNIEKKYVCKNGSLLDVSVSSGVVHNNDGSIAYFSSIIQDITQRKKSEELLKQSEAALRELNATKDKFFSIIAHDLRSPFNTFLGFTQIMVEELDEMTHEEITTIVASMRKSATNVYGLLENLLEWAQLQRGLTTFRPTAFLLMPKISESMQPVLETADKKGIKVNYGIPKDLMVFADENMLGSIIRNLASNAVKFTSRGGKISITAKPFSGSLVEIAIMDTGIGMNDKMIDNLFRLDINTNRNGTEGESSTGLGLIICKDFVEKHEGKIWTESEEGKGSTFYFTLQSQRSFQSRLR